MARGQGSLLRLAGCKFWYADYYENGKRKRVSTREENKVDAQRVLNRLLSERDEGGTQTDPYLRYGDLRAALIQNYKELGNKSLHVRANGDETITGLKQLDQFFGYTTATPGPYLKDINTETGRAFVRERKREGAGNAVINRSLACLRRMLKLAQEEGKLKAAPVIRLLKEPPARQGIVTAEKFAELLRNLPTRLCPLIAFMYWAGVRVGEALQIEWEQVDLASGFIYLREGETKNDEPRIIPLSADVTMLLEEIEPKEGRVFDSTNLRKAWQAACVAAGLGTQTQVEGKPYDPHYEGLNIHDLRRTALTELTRSGVHMFVAMRISGHKDPHVFQRYNIVNTQDLASAMRLREQWALNNGGQNSAKNSVKKLK